MQEINNFTDIAGTKIAFLKKTLQGIEQLNNRGFAITSTISKRPNGRYCFKGEFKYSLMDRLHFFLTSVKSCFVVCFVACLMAYII